MKVAYASRIGIEACILRARDSLYWPRMTTEEYIAECGICLTHRDAQSKEQLLQHEIVARPWSKVGGDLCELNGCTLLVIVVYFSNFIEVARITTVTSRNIITKLKEVFARFGIPAILL